MLIRMLMNQNVNNDVSKDSPVGCDFEARAQGVRARETDLEKTPPIYKLAPAIQATMYAGKVANLFLSRSQEPLSRVRDIVLTFECVHKVRDHHHYRTVLSCGADSCPVQG